MNKLIAIVGMCGTGKSIASKFFKDRGYEIIHFGSVTFDLLNEEKLSITPENERMMREKIRREYGMAAFAKLLLPKIEKTLEESNVVLDGLYSWEEYKVLEEKFANINLIAIITDKYKRYERLSKRDIRPFKHEDAVNRDITEIENLSKGGPIAYADFYAHNNGDVDALKERLEELKNIIEEEE